MLNEGTDSKSGKDFGFKIFTRKVKTELIKPVRHWGKKINYQMISRSIFGSKPELKMTLREKEEKAVHFHVGL